jgi:hypothetical protein
MTDHVARLYALALGSLLFLVAWAVVAANPFPEAKPDPDPTLAALQKREARLGREQERANRLVEHRFAVYRRKLVEQRRLQAALDAAVAPVAAAASPAAAAPSSAPAPAPAAPAAPAVEVTSSPPVTSSGSS